MSEQTIFVVWDLEREHDPAAISAIGPETAARKFMAMHVGTAAVVPIQDEPMTMGVVVATADGTVTSVVDVTLAMKTERRRSQG